MFSFYSLLFLFSRGTMNRIILPIGVTLINRYVGNLHKKIGLNQISLLQEISKSTFLETFYSADDKQDIHLYLSTAFSVETLQKELLNPDSFFYLAYWQTNVIGYLKVNIGLAQTENMGEDYFEIQRIYVDRHYHGKGIGDALIQQAFYLAQTFLKKYIWLGVWEENYRAVHFYKKFGFESFGSHSFKYGSRIDTDIIMRKTLQY